jgi:hypothetical protein
MADEKPKGFGKIKGKAKQVLAEVVGDGELYEEGKKEATGQKKNGDKPTTIRASIRGH